MSQDKARDKLTKRAQEYRTTFDNPVGQNVLHDLALFCRANESTFTDNDRTSALLEGRREVWLRIQRHLQLDQKSLWRFHGLDGE